MVLSFYETFGVHSLGHAKEVYLKETQIIEIKKIFKSL